VSSLSEKLKEQAKQAGFDGCRITSPGAIPQAAPRLREYLALGRYGDMGWMQSTADRRADPQVLWPEAKSIIMLSMSYASKLDPRERLKAADRGNISIYALGRDYHDVIKGKLKHVAAWLAKETQADVKVFVDTAPLMEKPLAQAAGLGWQGKHTNLVSRESGSWFFLGAILTTAELPRDGPEPDRCGSCRNCLDICPTKAFPAPYQLDARRCISYLTIEHKGHIAREFRHAMGNRIYGCDDCLAVCPWNKFAQEAREARLKARSELVAPELLSLLQLDDEAFRKLFAGSPIKRTGRDRFLRNVLIAAGNLETSALVGKEFKYSRSDVISQVERLLSDASPLVRAMAVWALARLAGDRFSRLKEMYLQKECDEEVRQEWLAAA
jgi:epoxyqueuosine reductase